MRCRVLTFLVLVLFPVGVLAQAPPPAPPDDKAQLGQCLGRLGQYQTLAREDRDALILYFQSEIRKLMQERDEATKHAEDTKRALEKEKN